VSLRERINNFLAQKRIAMIGVSRNPRDFSRHLFHDMKNRGYEMIPVNPNAAEIEGEACYAHVSDIPGGVTAALLMTSAAEANQVVNECIDAGVEQIWFFRATGDGALSRSAVQQCETYGLEIVPGECPYMFLPNAGFPHNVHGWVHTALSSRYRA
jgi:predicted CoA-binding protein